MESILQNVILERASVRNFDKDKKVEKTILEKILLAGVRAPSAGNIQPRTIIHVEDKTIRESLFQLCERQAFMMDAPVWLVVCVDLHRHIKAARLTGVEYDFTGAVPFVLGVIDASLSLENMVLAAEAVGLGSVIVGSVIEHPEEVREILHLPDHCLAISILCVGYPKRRPLVKEKWSSSIIVPQDSYRDVELRDVAEYWKSSVAAGLRRSGKNPSDEEIDRVSAETNYGKTYASHYKEDFIRSSSENLMSYLKKHGFLK